MKKRNLISPFARATLCCLVTALLTTGCMDDHADTVPGNPLMPIEIAKYLTSEEIDAFYLSKPTYLPASDRQGDTGNETWHPFFAWGDIHSATYPVLSGCDDPVHSVICTTSAGEHDFAQWVGLVTQGNGSILINDHLPASFSWKQFNCEPGEDTDSRSNGTIVRDGNALHFQTTGLPVAMPFKGNLNNNQAQSIFRCSPTCPGPLYPENNMLQLDYQIAACIAASPDPKCWNCSTGDYSKAEGVLNLRWVIPATASSDRPFESKDISMATWGWLYY